MTTKERVTKEGDTKRKGRGGDRGGRRPKTGRDVSVTLRISQEAKDKLDTIPNRSKWLDETLKKMK
jgi:hypothetical protein